MSDDKAIDTHNGDVDLTKKKKKKKKVNIDEEPAVEEVVEKPVEKPAEKPADKPAEPDATNESEFDTTKKKKKKKPVEEDAVKAAEEVPAEVAAPVAAAEEDGDALDLKKKKKKKKTEEAKASEEAATTEEAPAEDVLNLDKDKKKKKKSKDKEKDKEAKAAADGDSADKPEVASDSQVLPWAGSDRDYTYEELLKRVTDILREKNPELGGEKKRFAMKPPDVVREGTKKTVFLNFADICKTMHRNIDHVYQFMLAELGTSGSIDGSMRMVIKGRFQQRAIESILRRYVLEYVTCLSCKSPDTNLSKDNRLFFVDCNQCGAKRSVAAIKQGYVAQVGKRKKV